MKKGMTEKFASKLGIITATAGSAIGLGNIWGFPYKVGANGGSFFILIYIFFTVYLGLPLMISEFIIGKNGERDTITSFEKLSSRKLPFKLIGVVGVLNSYLILIFYSVVAGWSVVYLLEGIVNGYSEYSAQNSPFIFNGIIKNFKISTSGQIIFMTSVVIILLKGVQAGIENISRILMPILLAVIIALVIHGLTLSGAREAYRFLLKPNLDIIESKPLSVASVAMTQVFFSLSLGVGVITTYGAYVDKKTDIVEISKKVILADTTIAILAGFAIFPIVFTAGITPSGGPGLMFVSLPIGFSLMPNIAGRILGILFFGSLLVAAITSGVGFLESVVSVLNMRYKIGRKKAVILSGVVIFIMGLTAQLAFDIGIPFLNWTGEVTLLDQVNKLTIKILTPITAFCIAIFVGYRLKYEYIRKEFKYKNDAKIFHIYVKYVVPILILILAIRGILDLNLV